jgi:hypothetical protein
MRWTYLDYGLLAVAVLAGVLTGEHITNAATGCRIGICAPILWYQQNNGTFWELDNLDCDKCARANGSCPPGPWNPNCFPTANNVRKRQILTGGVADCPLPPPLPPIGGVSYGEAQLGPNPTYGAWSAPFTQWTCQP